MHTIAYTRKSTHTHTHSHTRTQAHTTYMRKYACKRACSTLTYIHMRAQTHRLAHTYLHIPHTHKQARICILTRTHMASTRTNNAHSNNPFPCPSQVPVHNRACVKAPLLCKPRAPLYASSNPKCCRRFCGSRRLHNRLLFTKYMQQPSL